MNSKELENIAIRVASSSFVAARKKPKKNSRRQRVSERSMEQEIPSRIVMAPSTEFSCHLELVLNANFEGDSSKQAVMKKLRGEILAAVNQAAKITARDLLLETKSVSVKPVVFDCAVNSIDNDID